MCFTNIGDIISFYFLALSRFSYLRAKRIFYLSLVSQLGPCATNWIKTKVKFASREKIRKWKSGFSGHTSIAHYLAVAVLPKEVMTSFN
jgi:hypothetical protein